MITWIWIEGERALDDFCLRRFGETPRWIENTGYLSEAKVQKEYKWREDKDDYVAMFLLQMEAPHDRCTNLACGGPQMDDIRAMTYEQIRLDRTAILRR